MIVNVDMLQNEHSLGVIGKRGENLATEIICNCGDPPVPHDDIRYECVCLREGDAYPYLIPVEVIDGEDGSVSLRIALTSYETYRIGTLSMEFRMLVQISDDSTAVIKSALFVGDIVPGIIGEVDEQGMPVRDALDRLDESIDAANDATQRAEAAALLSVRGVMVDGTELERDAQQRVDIPLVTRYTTGLLRASDYARIMAVVDNPPVTDITSMSRIVQSLPLADLKTMFKVGDQIIAPWRDLDDNAHSLDYNAYVTAWNIAHVGMVERQDGLTVPGIYLQMHKCSAYGVQYSHQQAFYQAFNAALPSGTYNVTFGVKYNDTFTAGTTGQFTLTQNLPVEGRLLLNGNKVEAWASATAASATESVNLTIGTGGTSLGSITSNNERSPDNLNAMNRILYGHNRGSTSGLRQYLNSDKTNYFSSKEDFDLRPNEYAKHGFMAGFNDDFLNAIKPVKVTTALNTVEGYAETTEDTFDTFFLPSLEQMDVYPQLVGAEGEAFDYWKQALGSESFVGTGSANVFDALKIPAINNNSAQNVRLRSAYRGGASNTWSVNSSGYVSNGGAYYALRFSPVCVIC